MCNLDLWVGCCRHDCFALWKACGEDTNLKHRVSFSMDSKGQQPRAQVLSFFTELLGEITERTIQGIHTE